MIEEEKVLLQDLYVVMSLIKREIKCIYVYIIRRTVSFQNILDNLNMNLIKNGKVE